MLTRAQIPNALTFARVLAVPVSLALILAQPSCLAMALLVIFVLASLTDFLDGYLARRWQVVSPLGTFLDPVADKLLVALMLVYLLMEGGAAYASLLFLPVVVIVLRELFVSALREFLAARSIALPVSRGGKWKTALQMLAITLLLAAPVVAADAAAMVAQAGRCALYLAAILAFTSALQYARAGLKSLP